MPFRRGYERYKRVGLATLLTEIPGYVGRFCTVENLQYLLVVVVMRVLGIGFLTREALVRRDDAVVRRFEEERPVEILGHEEETAPPEFRDRSGVYHPERRTVSTLRDVKVLGALPLFFTADNDIVMPLSENNFGRMEKRVKRRLSAVGVTGMVRDLLWVRFDVFSEPVRFEDTVLPLVTDTGYYHWVLEHLPKLRDVDDLWDDPTVLFRESAPRWATESTETMARGELDKAEWTDERGVIELAVVPTHRSRMGGDYHPSRADSLWVRSRAFEAVGVTESSSERRLFVTRRDAATRNIRNFRAVREALGEIGFETVTLSNYSFEEQVELFADAELVVGTHGAGLTNIVFAEDVTLIELLPENYTKASYYALCCELDAAYEYVRCASFERDEIEVDVRELEATIESTRSRTVRS